MNTLLKHIINILEGISGARFLHENEVKVRKNMFVTLSHSTESFKSGNGKENDHLFCYATLLIDDVLEG